MNEDILIRRLDKIEKKLNLLLEKKRDIWIGAADLMKLTGWNKDDMYRMRKTGVVVFKKVGNAIVYDVSSVPSIFIRYENSTNRDGTVDRPGAVTS